MIGMFQQSTICVCSIPHLAYTGLSGADFLLSRFICWKVLRKGFNVKEAPYSSPSLWQHCESMRCYFSCRPALHLISLVWLEEM